MSSLHLVFDDSLHSQTQAQEATIEFPARKETLALVNPEIPLPDSCFLTPNAVKSLVEQQVQVFVQHGFGNHNPYSDADYAEAGVEFAGLYADLAMLGRTLLKYDAFTFDQLALSKPRQTLVSVLSPEEVSREYVEAVNERKATMLCLDLLADLQGIPSVERIRKETLSDAGFQIALSNYLLPIVETLAHSPKLSMALRRCPEILPCVLCHDGALCNSEVAGRLHMPCSDGLAPDSNLN